MPKETYTVILTRKELGYILETLKDDQETLSYFGAYYDFLNRLIDKLDSIFAKED